MKYLLDTHVLLWALKGVNGDGSEFPVNIKKIFLDEQNEIGFLFHKPNQRGCYLSLMMFFHCFPPLKLVLIFYFLTAKYHLRVFDVGCGIEGKALIETGDVAAAIGNSLNLAVPFWWWQNLPHFRLRSSTSQPCCLSPSGILSYLSYK